MPARDFYHDAVQNALVKDGWAITDDPLHLEWGDKDMYVDLGAEEVLAAERGGRKIAVEIKNFLGPSEMKDLEQAIGQFRVYHAVITRSKPEYTLHLAVPQFAIEEVFREPLEQLLLDNESPHVIGFDPIQETITEWLP